MQMVSRCGWILAIVIACASGLPLSAHGTAAWIPGHGVSAYYQLNFLKANQGALYALQEWESPARRLCRSDDLGDTWTPVGPPFPSPARVGAMEIHDSQIFLMTWGGGVWRLSSPEDTAWIRAEDGLRSLDSLHHMARSGSALLLAAAYGLYSWSSADGRWMPSGDMFRGPPGLGVDRIAMAETTLFVTATDGFLYRGAPAGTGWNWSKLPFQGGPSLLREGRFLFATGKASGETKPSVFRSGDNGNTWQKKAAELPIEERLSGGPILLTKIGSNLFVSLHDGGNLYLSPDEGETWTPFAAKPANRPLYIEALEAVGSDLVAMSEEGLFRLSTGFTSVRPIRSLAGPRLRLQDGNRTLRYRFDSPGWARLDLFTAAGRLEFPVFQGLQAGGTQAFPLAPRIRPGIYLVRVKTQGAETSHTLRIE